MSAGVPFVHLDSADICECRTRWPFEPLPSGHVELWTLGDGKDSPLRYVSARPNSKGLLAVRCGWAGGGPAYEANGWERVAWDPMRNMDILAPDDTALFWAAWFTVRNAFRRAFYRVAWCGLGVLAWGACVEIPCGATLRGAIIELGRMREEARTR